MGRWVPLEDPQKPSPRHFRHLIVSRVIDAVSQFSQPLSVANTITIYIQPASRCLPVVMSCGFYPQSSAISFQSGSFSFSLWLRFNLPRLRYLPLHVKWKCQITGRTAHLPPIFNRPRTPPPTAPWHFGLGPPFGPAIRFVPTNELLMRVYSYA